MERELKKIKQGQLLNTILNSVLVILILLNMRYLHSLIINGDNELINILEQIRLNLSEICSLLQNLLQLIGR